MTKRPNNAPVGTVRILYKRNHISCWIMGGDRGPDYTQDREDYEWTINEAIRLHPAEKIHAGWVYQGNLQQGVREDRTRYSLEAGRRDYQRGVPIVFSPDDPIPGWSEVDGKETA